MQLHLSKPYLYLLCEKQSLLLNIDDKATDFHCGYFHNIDDFRTPNRRKQRSHCTKNEVSIKDFFSKCDQVRNTEEILNGKTHFLCSVGSLGES